MATNRLSIPNPRITETLHTATKTLDHESILRRLSLDRTVFGKRVCPALTECIVRLDSQRVLLVHDPIATDACKITKPIVDCLSVQEKCGVIGISSTLSPYEVDSFGAICEEGLYDSIVAVGGGATMDAAKLVALRASNSKPIVDLVRDGFAPNRIPIIAAPTTAGSGSEATHFAVLFVGNEKYSVAHESLLPEWAVVDPALTHSSPQNVSAASGLDVLCQSIESLWSVHADAKSKAFAKEAIQLVVPSLRDAVINRDSTALARVSLASHLAGQAINRSFTTVCHAMSYLLTARYAIPHGFAVAATLPAAISFNAEATTIKVSADHDRGNDSEWITILLQTLECDEIETAICRLVSLIRSLGAAASIEELSLPSDYCPTNHAESVDQNRLQNNPRPVEIEDSLRLLLKKVESDGRISD